MPHALPTSIRTRADGSRVSTVATWYIQQLTHDPRVQALYGAWRLTLAKKEDCRRFGRSRKPVHKWKQRHAEHGDARVDGRRHGQR